jgi:hypothetical protein
MPWIAEPQSGGGCFFFFFFISRGGYTKFRVMSPLSLALRLVYSIAGGPPGCTPLFQARGDT